MSHPRVAFRGPKGLTPRIAKFRQDSGIREQVEPKNAMFCAEFAERASANRRRFASNKNFHAVISFSSESLQETVSDHLEHQHLANPFCSARTVLIGEMCKYSEQARRAGDAVC